MLGDLFVAGQGAGLTRGEPQDATAADLADFLGEAGRPLLACGAMAASRVAYGAGDAEWVALLVVFPDADHARCGYDAGRAPEHEALAPSKNVTGDVRTLAFPSGERVAVTLVRGVHVLRVLAPATASALKSARALALEQHAALPDDGGESALWKRMPSGYLVGNTTRVVTASPISDVEGVLWAVARYSCEDGVEVTGHITRLKDEETANEVRGTFQVRAAREKQTVTSFKLGETLVVGTLDNTTGRETLMLRQGAMLGVLADVPSRRGCAPVIESLAAAVAP
jgi:hypothetical protein